MRYRCSAALYDSLVSRIRGECEIPNLIIRLWLGTERAAMSSLILRVSLISGLYICIYATFKFSCLSNRQFLSII